MVLVMGRRARAVVWAPGNGDARSDGMDRLDLSGFDLMRVRCLLFVFVAGRSGGTDGDGGLFACC